LSFSISTPCKELKKCTALFSDQDMVIVSHTVALTKQHALPNWNETSQDGSTFSPIQKNNFITQ